MAVDSIFDNSIRHSEKTYGNSGTSGTRVGEDQKSVHCGRGLAKGSTTSTEEFLKPAPVGMIKRGFNLLKSAFTGNKPAPPAAEASKKFEASKKSVLDQEFKVPLPKDGFNLDLWHELIKTPLKFYSADELSHRTYDLFKQNLYSAVDRAKPSVNQAFSDSLGLPKEECIKISDKFLNGLKESIGPALDMNYRAIRASYDPDNELSTSMPSVLLLAFESAQATAMGEVISKFPDGIVDRVASQFIFNITEVGSEDKNNLPLRFTFEAKADVIQSSQANVEERSVEKALTVAIWNGPFSAKKFLEDQQSPNNGEVKTVATDAVSETPESPALDQRLPVENRVDMYANALKNMAHLTKTSQEALPLVDDRKTVVEGYSEVDESKWVSSQPSFVSGKALLSSEPGSLISKDNKDVGKIERIFNVLIQKKNVPTFDNPAYRTPVELVAGDAIEIAGHDLNAPAEDKLKDSKFDRSGKLAKNPSGNNVRRVWRSLKKGFGKLMSKVLGRSGKYNVSKHTELAKATASKPNNYQSIMEK